MSDTPETDGKAVMLSACTDYQWVPAEFARKLERERDKAIHGACVNYNFTQIARRERDEARKLADAFHADQTALLLKIERLKIDRDQALNRLQEVEIGRAHV